MRPLKMSKLLSSAAILCVPFLSAQPVYAEKSVSDVVTGGKFTANVRLRYEFVDQDGFANDANTKTARLRLGYETGAWKGLSLLGEIDGTTHFGSEDFNSKENGNTAYPVVADPNSFRLNRFNVKYTDLPDTVVKLGRQRIILGDARFVGNVGWRQNEQTFDALRITNTSLKDIQANYSYIWQVNGILGSNAVLGDFASDSHLVDLSYNLNEQITLSGFGHWLDFEAAKETSSLATYGLRIGGDMAVSNEMTLTYNATYAHQEDNAENTASISEDYYSAAGGLKWQGFTAGLGYDVFTGNGTVAFQTPLATGHKFQGFADVFLTTPADGLKDMNASLGYKVPAFSIFPKGINLLVAFHDFEAENTSQDMGSEIDAQVVVPLEGGLKFLTKYANYDGASFAADRQKVMVELNYNF
jgi:hypothetical protein